MKEFPTLAALRAEADKRISPEQIEAIALSYLPKLAEEVKKALAAKGTSAEYSLDYSDLSAMQRTYGQKFFEQQRDVYESMVKKLEGKGFASVTIQDLPKDTGGYYGSTQCYSLHVTWK